MIKNYLKTALRNLIKHKADAGINLLGLILAFTSALLIFLSLFYEFSFDRFHANRGRIYHVLISSQTPEQALTGNTLPGPMLPTLKAAYPEVEGFARYHSGSCPVEFGDKKLDLNVRFTDPDFLAMFSFPLKEGSPQTALNRPDGVVITEKSAKALFGTTDAVGKTMRVHMNGGWHSMAVTAVAADVPDNSSIRFDMLVRFDQGRAYTESHDSWDNWNHQGYVLLREGESGESLSAKMKPFMERYLAGDIENLKKAGAHPDAGGQYISAAFQPLDEVHTDPEHGGEDVDVRKSYLYLLMTVGILIVLIACINFINLSIGRSFARTREVGLRKTLGAQPWQVSVQFWLEIGMLCLAAFVLSALSTWYLMPWFRQTFALNIKPEMLLTPTILGGAVAVFLVITLLAGAYPVWLLARLQVADVLRGRTAGMRPSRVRNSLIVVQFSISTGLLICTMLAWQQIDFLRKAPLGYNRSQVVSVPIEGLVEGSRMLPVLRQELAGQPGILDVSGIYNNLGRGTDGSSRHSKIGFGYKDRVIKTNWMGVSHDFVETLDLKLIAGRDFDPTIASDTDAIVVNEQMAAAIGSNLGAKGNYADVIGTPLPIHENHTPIRVIGVVKDFNFESLHREIEPISLTLEKDFGVNYALVKVAPEDLPGSMRRIKQAYKRVLPNGEFQGSFLDENIERQYKQEERLGTMFISAAVIAIVLSCMGLLAIVILVLAQRTREIGIRKVLGASVSGLVGFIFKDFLRLVLLSILIASPVAWLAANRWLQDFSYRIDIAWWVFAAAGLFTIGLALLTVAARALRAAMANPVKSLRTE